MRKSRTVILAGVLLVLLAVAGAVTLVMKTRPRGVGAAPAAPAVLTGDEWLDPPAELPRDPKQRAALVADFGELADALHRLEGFWGNTDALDRADRALAALKAKSYPTTRTGVPPSEGGATSAEEEAAYLMAVAGESIAAARKANEQALDAIDALDHDAGLHKDPASQPTMFPTDFEAAERRGANTGKSASYNARAFFNRYDELRGVSVR